MYQERWSNQKRVALKILLREGFKEKNLCKFTHLGGWVGQEWDKLHRKNKKKHAFKIHFRPF